MRGIAFALLCALGLGSLALASSPAQAGNYGYYGDGYYLRHHYSHVGYRPYYRHRHRHTRVWYTSSCCYRKVVRHTRSVHYQRLYEGEGYPDYGRSYHRSYYSRPNYTGYYGRRYRYSGYYGYPYHRPYYSDYVRRPYRYYDRGYDSVGYSRYASCRKMPLRDGHGGWVWSRRAGCF